MSTLYKNAPNKPRTTTGRGGLLFVLFLLLGIGVGFGQNPFVSIDDPVPVAEGDALTATLTFTVSLDVADPLNATTVNYTISGGNEDGTTADVVIPANSTSATIDVTTNGDTVIEADETVTVTLNTTDNGTLSPTENEGTSSFTDDDSVVVSIDDPVPVAEGDALTATLTFTVSLDVADPLNATTVNYTISGGNEDGTTADVVIPANSTSATIDVTTTGDTVIEADETVTVTLNTTDNGTLSPT